MGSKMRTRENILSCSQCEECNFGDCWFLTLWNQACRQGESLEAVLTGNEGAETHADVMELVVFGGSELPALRACRFEACHPHQNLTTDRRWLSGSSVRKDVRVRVPSNGHIESAGRWRNW